MQNAIAWRWSEDPEQKRWMDWKTDWTHHDKAKAMGFPVEYAVAQSALNEPGKVYHAMLRGEIPKLTWRQMVHLSGPVPNTADEALAEIARLREELQAAKSASADIADTLQKAVAPFRDDSHLRLFPTCFAIIDGCSDILKGGRP